MITISKSTIKRILLSLTSIFALGLVVFLLINPPQASSGSVANAVEQDNGKQVIAMTAKAGFKPSSFTAAGNKSTVLRVTTKNTFDCSSSISIPSLGISKNLPMTGETDIELPPQAAGTKVTGTCSMGMYSFTINFT